MFTVNWGSSVCLEPVLTEMVAPDIPARPVKPFRIATFNIAEETSAERVLEVLHQTPNLEDLDVLLLQEVVYFPKRRDNLVNVLVDRLKLHALFGTAAEPKLGGELEGIAILSRRPLRDAVVFDLERFGLNVRSRCRVALGATVDLPNGPVRLLDVHLDTRINADDRIKQLQPVLEAAERFDGPVILGGDFNTNSNYWIQHLAPIPFGQDQGLKVRQYLATRGFKTPQHGGPATFKYLPFRLDWVYLRSLSAAKWGVEPVDFSDHRAVWVTLEGRKAEP